MTEPARIALAAALLCSLTLLQRVAPGGAWALGGGLALVVLAAAAGPPARRRGLRLEEDLRTFLAVISLLLTALVVAGAPLLEEGGAGGGLSWLARTLSLVSLLLLPRTPLAWLPAHGLSVMLALWTAAAFHDRPRPEVAPLLLGALALGLTVQAFVLAHAAELERAAAASITTGVAPTPWGLRPRRAPALTVLLLALAPLALGVPWPRLELGSSEPPPAPGAGGPARAPRQPLLSAGPSDPWHVAFNAELRTDSPRGPTQRGDAEVARVRLTPSRPFLYLRGAELLEARDNGFFPPAGRPAAPRLRPPTETTTFEVELLQPQDQRVLLVDAEPLAFRGVEVRWRGVGPTLAGRAAFPLRYEVDCVSSPGTQDPDDLRPFLDLPAARALPSGLADLRARAEQVAWGRSVHARVSNAIRYLGERCTYTLRRTRPRGLDLSRVVRRFLDEDRRGVCEEFALTCAVLLRLVDVPVRVVTGYRTIERDDEGRFRVRTRDAHAWIEVAYEGAGWVAYDPTPPSSQATSPSGAEELPPPAPTPGAEDGPADPEEAVAALTGRGLGYAVLAALAALAAAALIAPGRLRRAVRARQLGQGGQVDPALRDLRERLFEHLARRGFTLDGLATPREFVAARPAAEPDLAAAVEVYTELRFSGRHSPTQEGALREHLERLDRLAEEQG
ncbi:MAG: transglutaminase family protein [Planctomycetota bacterium]